MLRCTYRRLCGRMDIHFPFLHFNNFHFIRHFPFLTYFSLYDFFLYRTFSVFPSELPIVDFINTWTFVTVFTSRHLSPNIWEYSTIDWFTFFGLLPGRAVSISWIWLVYFLFGLLLGTAVPIGCGLLWFTYRLLTNYWFLPFCWFTLVYLVYEIYFLDMSKLLSEKKNYLHFSI